MSHHAGLDKVQELLRFFHVVLGKVEEHLKTVAKKIPYATVWEDLSANPLTLKDCISELRWTLPMFLGIYNAYAIPTIDLSRLRADPTTRAG